MKASAVLIFLFLLYQLIPAQWFWQNPLPQGNTLLDLEVISKNEIYACGIKSFLKSVDGGQNWARKDLPVDAFSCWKMCSDKKNNVWITGKDFQNSDNYLLKSSDNGESWSIKLMDNKYEGFTDILFCDSALGFILTSDRGMLKSTDGGETWTRRTTDAQTLFSLNAVSRKLIFAAANDRRIFRSTDEGETWTPLYVGIGNYYTVEFIDSLNGWIGGQQIMKTTDGGITWKQISGLSTAAFFDLKMISTDIIYVSLSDNSIRKTTDAGESWTTFYPSVEPGLLTVMNFYDENTGWTANFKGNIYKTTDGGNSWKGNPEQMYTDLYSIYFLDNNIGWASGLGLVLHTTDGGTNWNIISNRTTNSQRCSIFFTNENSGWIADAVNIIHTTDGGQNWRTQYNIDPYWFRSIYFINDSTGWACGNLEYYNSFILKTTNGGDYWTNQNQDSYLGLYSIFFNDEDYGWAAGPNVVLRTTNGGEIWLKDSSNYGTISSIDFIDHLNGLMVTQEHQIYETTNGGLSWDSIPNQMSGSLFQVNYINKNTAYAVGSGIYKSTDGGDTWTSQNSPAEQLLYSCFFDSENIGWAAGLNGTIIKTINGGVTFAEVNNGPELQPQEYNLFQNYPNPFNPSTTITYQLPEPGFVTLIIYDMIGKVAAMPLNEYQNEGKYSLKINAGNLASGLYFYQLKVNDFSAVKKMILIK